MMKNYGEFLRRQQSEHGAKFDSSDLNADFILAYESGKRVEVLFRTSNAGKVYEAKRGTIGVTTGWKPCFLLMLRSNSSGSTWTIGKKDAIARYID